MKSKDTVHTLDLLAEFVTGKMAQSGAACEIIESALIDTLGCIIAGSRQTVAINSRQAATHFGSGATPIIGTAEFASAPVAAFLNAVAGHASDFDDWELPGNTHPSVVLFPAILAACQIRPASGSDILDAYIAGFEVIVRLGEAFNFEHYDRGWHSTATLGPLGAAAAVSRILNLNGDQTRNALSIATSRASGYTCQFGSHAKPLQAGFASETGVTAALLALNGLTGQPHILDSVTGFNALLAHGDPDRLNAIRDRIGQPLAIIEHGLVRKRYPSCGYTHRVMDAALDLRSAQAIEPDAIASVTACLPDFHAAILPFVQPTNRPEALFSVPFCVSAILIDGRMNLTSLEQARWHDQELTALISRTRLTTRKPKNPRLNYDPDDPDWVEVELLDSTRFRSEVPFPVGAPERPLTFADVLEKFEDNVAFLPESARPAASALKGWSRKESVVSLLHLFAN